MCVCVCVCVRVYVFSMLCILHAYSLVCVHPLLKVLHLSPPPPRFLYRTEHDPHTTRQVRGRLSAHAGDEAVVKSPVRPAVDPLSSPTSVGSRRRPNHLLNINIEGEASAQDSAGESGLDVYTHASRWRHGECERHVLSQCVWCRGSLFLSLSLSLCLSVCVCIIYAYI